uniref:histidine kinase n=1 Tax=Magnetococcus massalia (strain MO-1) TaxID=451514 RepID=A0A1S7LE89_MAGMO|nr:Exported protein of unknown function Containing NMT1/THI5 like domain [Candidatus Magnetococcus massalia]
MLLTRFTWLRAALLMVVLSPAQLWAEPHDELLPSDGLDTVIVQLAWRHQFQFAGYYAAVAQGYFREVGLHVVLVEGIEGEDPAQVVAHGDAHFGIGTPELVINRNQGLPVVALAAIHQHSPYAIVTLRKEGMESIHDLAKKRIMIEPNAAEVRAYLRKEGLDPSELQIVEHSFNLLSLIEGDVDAMTVYQTDEPFKLKQSGYEFNLYSARSGGVDFYGDVLFTVEDEIRNNPERVKAFMHAVKRGWAYAMQNQQEMVRLIYKHYTQRKSLKQLHFEAKASESLLQHDLVEIGYMNPGRWQHIAETYAKLGMLPADWNLEGFLYKEEQPTDWQRVYQVVGVASLLLLIVGAVGGRFYIISKKLRSEVAMRRTAEGQLHDALKQERNLLSIMAHDFRGPINAIAASQQFLEEVVEQDETPFLRRELTKIGKAANALENLIGICLVEDRVEGLTKEAFKPLDLRNVVQEMGEKRLQVYSGSSFTLTLPDEPCMVQGSSILLHLAIGNLLENAWKYGPKESEIRIILERRPHETVLSVIDRGGGIAEDELESVFKKHYRSIKTRFGVGSGLGLHAVRTIMEAHEGRAFAKAGPGGHFFLSFPVHVGE